jgi:hypothetical protein
VDGETPRWPRNTRGNGSVIHSCVHRHARPVHTCCTA